MMTHCVRALVFVVLVASVRDVQAQRASTDDVPPPTTPSHGSAVAAAATIPMSLPLAPRSALQRMPSSWAWRDLAPVAESRSTVGALEPTKAPDDSHRGRNVLIGAVIGAAAGAVLAAATCNGDCILSVGMVVAPAGGAAVGALIALLLTPVR
ncbi:MAG: hypothetical protein U0132_04220 [Gemmatimonadaceae bacterium]